MPNQVFNIPFRQPFWPCVAAALVEQKITADTTIWLPNQRCAARLQQALSTQLPAHSLLPTLRVITPNADDLIDAPTATPVLARQTRIAQRLAQKFEHISYAYGLRLAADIDGLHSQVITHGADWSQLPHLAPVEFKNRWEEQLELLHAAGLPSTDHTAAQTLAWQQQQVTQILKATTPHIAVGFSDTTPAGMEILQAILKSGGNLYLPYADTAAWANDLPPQHPQAPLKNLTEKLGVEAKEIQNVATVERKSNVYAPIQARNTAHEAASIALWLRESAELEKSAAVVTGNRKLAQMIQAELQRWGLAADDSGGQPLLTTSQGQLVVRLLQAVRQSFAPVELANLLEHRALKYDAKASDNLQLNVLRGLTPATGLRGVIKQAKAVLKAEKQTSVLDLLGALETDLGSWAQKPAGFKKPSEWLAELDSILENISINDVELAGIVEWQTLCTQLESIEQPLNFADFVELVLHSLQQTVYRTPRLENTPKLYIWGALEARLPQVDRLLVAEFTATDWPPKPQPNSLLATALAERLHLPDPSMQQGLAAHDLLGYLGVEELFVSYAQTSAEGEAQELSYLCQWLPDSLSCLSYDYAKLAQQLQRNKPSAYELTSPVAALPATSARPTKVSASGLTDLMNCPYKFYAGKVLSLRAPNAFNESPDAAIRGNLLHKVLEAFFTPVAGLPEPFGQPLVQTNRAAIILHLNTLAQAVLAQVNISSPLWLARWDMIWQAVADELIQRIAVGWKPIAFEVRHEVEVGPLTLHAQADAIAENSEQQREVVDYKTGSSEIKKPDIEAGTAPQLAVLGLVNNNVAELSLWQLKPGGDDALKVMSLGEKVDIAAYLSDAREGITAIGQHYVQPQTPLAATPGRVGSQGLEGPCRLCDFAGHCRVAEWSSRVDVEGVV